MKRFIGKSEAAPRPSLNDAIQGVEGRGESIDKKIARLETDLKKVRDQMSNMRDGVSKDLLKQKAMRIMKQKRMYEEQQGHLQQQQFNMDQTNFAIMGMKDNQVTYAAMKDGLKTMRREYKKLDIDKIERLQDSLADMVAMHNDVNEAFARSYEMPDVDEMELEAELLALGEDLEIGGTDCSYMDEALKAPIVPAATPTIGPAKDPVGIDVDEFGLPKIPELNYPSIN